MGALARVMVRDDDEIQVTGLRTADHQIKRRAAVVRILAVHVEGTTIAAGRRVVLVSGNGLMP